MTTAQDMVIHCLEDAHALEQSLARRLQAQRAMTPAGVYHRALELHAQETRGHAEAIAARLRELGCAPRGAERGAGIAHRIAGQLAAFGRGSLTLARGASVAEQLLENAKAACADEALEIATYDVLEALAKHAGDAETAVLAAAHRADDERMLETLTGLLPGLTVAAVDAAVERGSAASLAHVADG